MNFHPYALLVSLILIVVVAAGTLVHRNAPATTPTVSSWNTTSVPLGRIDYATTAANSSDQTPTGTFKIGTTLPTFTFAANQAAHTVISEITSGPSNTLSNLYSYLGGTRSGNATNAPDPFTDFKSSLTFSSAVSTSSTMGATTSAQDALHTYGNAAGNVVRTLETANANENADLDAFFKSPNDTTAAPVIAIAQHLIDAAAGLRAISGIPTEAQAKNEALAASYADIGAKLAQIAAIRNSADFIAPITTYEGGISNLGIAYVALVLFFQEQKITFGNSENGSVFVFSGTL